MRHAIFVGRRSWNSLISHDPQKNEMKEKLLCNVGSLLYWLIGLFLFTIFFLLLWIETRSEQVMFVSGKYLVLATIAVSIPLLYFMYRSIRQDLKNGQVDYSPVFTFLVTLVGGPFFIFTCAYTLCIVLNAVLPPQSNVVYKGQIIKKDIRQKKSGTYYYFTIDSVDSYGLELTLEVSSRSYSSYKLGDTYRQYLMRGGLGIDYHLRW